MIAETWFKWTVSVQRLTGNGAYGPVHADAVPVLGRITAKRKLIRAVDGTEVISEARVSMSVDTADIPVGSLITLPERFGGRVAEVLQDQRHDDGNDLTPNYYSVDIT